ncbi:MAG: adenylate/guanylate cyclase domain-containing protein, partial [Actinomycetota bacterium]
MIGSTTSMLVGGRGPIPAAEAGDVRDDAFLPYLPRLIREWAADPSLRHRQVDGSMLFVDLTGFTAMSERLARAGNVGAEEVTGIISETFAELLRHAYSHGGSLLKFGGDALLILFTDPDHALRAAAAGHNMKRALYDIGAITTSVGSIRLSMTGGIHSGTFDLFLAGDDPHELLITGPAASTVVATEGTARSGEIIVSEATASLLPPQDLSTRDDGTARLRRAPAIAGRPDVSEYAASASLADFVPAAVRRRVDAGESDPEHRRATIGFLKFQGVDALAIADPEDAAKELNRLVTDAQRAAGKHGATFLASDIDTDGGKLILVAGAPSATGHDEESMLLILRDVVSVDRGINVRAGAAAGTVFFGDVGPSFRRTLTVMGDTVNLSARLMAAADTGSVVTTRETLNESSVCFNVNRLDPLHLKGKKQAVEAVEVGTPSGKADHVDRSVPLIGRDTEMAVIRDALNGLPDGSGGAIEVRADPGMGKSMLLSTMLDSVPGARVLRVGCDLYDASTPYRAAQQLLSAFTGIDPAEPNATRDLHELVTAAAPELGPMLPLIATAFRMDMDDSPEVAALQPEFRNEVLYRTVGELISAMATDSAVAVIDDSHWADAASRDLLGSLAALAADRPWLLVFAGNTWTFHDDTVANHRIELGPLDHADAVDLANALTADRPIAPHEVEAIATRSGGVPTFLHGLIDAVLDGGDIDALPVGVEGMIAARLDEPPRRAAQVAVTAT